MSDGKKKLNKATSKAPKGGLADAYDDAVAENLKQANRVAKPHHYGMVGGVHVFHATHEAHKGLIGIHLTSPSDAEMQDAVARAKGDGHAAVVIHGNAPGMLRARVSAKGEATLQGKVRKSEEDAVRESLSKYDLLEKAFLQSDGETKTGEAHDLAAGPVPEDLMEWGSREFGALEPDAIHHAELHGHTIKVRKLAADQYSGWIEKGSGKVHQFERVTLPEMLQQVRSKLEMYGVGEKLGELKDKVEVSAKDLEGGMLAPEEECEACENASEKCSCYTGLPAPRLEFDGKKVTIFFKSEWGDEDRDNFVEDLKRRAGKVLERRERLEKARAALDDIRKRLNKKGS